MNHIQAFSDLAEALHEPAFLVSGKGRILGANRGGRQLLGAGAAPGALLQDLVADPHEKLQTYLKCCARSRSPVVGSLRWLTASGQVADHRAEGALVRPRDGPEESLILLRTTPRSASSARFIALNRKIDALAKEIHERRQVQEALRQSEERLQAILDNSAAVIYLKDLAGRYALVNRKFETVLGMARDRILGKTDFDLLPEDSARAVSGNDHSVLKSGQPTELEESLPLRDGVRTFLTVRFPVRNLGGVYGICGIATDVTERKRFDDQLRQTQKLESLGLLAGGVAHDFNNLLTGILGSASLALDLSAWDNPARPLLADIVRASESAAHLTRQMLAYAGKGKFILECIDPSAMVREMVQLMGTSIPKKVDLQLRLAQDAPAIEADQGQIQQLVMNLVINAAEAIGDGPGTVLITTGSQTLDRDDLHANFVDLNPGVYLKLEVSDTGAGMDAATMARIFDPFFTTKFTGRGLGLSAAMGVVRSHRGCMRVYSEVGRGSTFVVLLPATAAKAKVSEAQPRVAQDLRGAGTALLADDEEVVRRTAKSMLERYGYSVLLAEDGEQAVELLRLWREQVAVVILDLTMPVMGGEEAFEQIRKIRPDVPVLLSSGYSEFEVARRFSGKDVTGFVQKPYSSALLLEKVKAALHASALRKGAV